MFPVDPGTVRQYVSNSELHPATLAETNALVPLTARPWFDAA
jgi:hypothetical protein